MTRYLLLRDNQQRGPYLLQEIIALGLRPSDLIWVQGVSTGWVYAGEIEELCNFVEASNENFTSQAHSPGMSFDNSFTREYPNTLRQTGTRLATNYSRPLDEIKELYVHHLQKKGKTKKYKLGLALAAVVTLLLGVFLFKKMTERPEVVQIKVAGATSPSIGEPVTNSENFQNALSKEFIPYEAKPKKIKPKDLKKLVAVEANDYHVRLLGGINDLKLTVQNYSEHLLDKVVIKVDYLKPKGDVINSEIVTLNNIKSQGSKSIDVPPSTRGVKIKYTVLSVHSQEYKTLSEEI